MCSVFGAKISKIQDYQMENDIPRAMKARFLFYRYFLGYAVIM